MKEQAEKPETGEHGHGHMITVSLDGEPKQIRQGRYEVADLKKVLGVTPGYDLDEIVDGVPNTLKDTDHINVKKGDVFVSHVPRGGAS